MRRSATVVAWSLLGILAVSAVLLTLSRGETLANPKIDSYRPSGLAAFANLLRENGYRVESTTSAFPRLAKGDIPIACVDESAMTDSGVATIDDDTPGALGHLSSFIQDGGRAIVLPFDREFSDNSHKVERREAQIDYPQSTLQAELRPREADVLPALPEELITAGIIHDRYSPKGDLAWLAKYTDGTVLCFADGYMATNRFIDHAGNADILINAITAIAPKGSHLVFLESTFTNEQPGLLEILGPGSTGAFYQAMFLFVVIIYTLGKRFGLPEERRQTQTGQRELVDAIADTYRRARSTRAACRAAYDRSDTEVRKALKLSSDAPASERDFRVPLELATAFRRVFEGTIDILTPQEAFLRCQTLRRQTSEFVRPGTTTVKTAEPEAQ